MAELEIKLPPDNAEESASGANVKTGPMMEQYRRIKSRHQDDILFFRLGDFYEMFAGDAIEVSALLNLTLTSRTGLPMCGVPYHAAKSYIARLLKLGKKIAICEQLTPAGKGNKVIERDVVEVITPGTTVDEEYLERENSNYLCCLALFKNKLSFSYIDLSSGDFFSTCFSKGDDETLRQELERLQIKETLIQESLLENKNISSALNDRSSLVINRLPDWHFDPAQARQTLEKQFELSNLKSFGLNEDSAEIVSAGVLLNYLRAVSKSLFPHIKTLNIYGKDEYVGLDEASQRNLELITNQRDANSRFSLLNVMDQTRCSMGRRLLKRRVLYPLRDIEKINNRLDIIEDLCRDQGKLNKLRELLGKTPDLERLCSRLAMDKAHARDMVSIRNAVKFYQDILALYHNDFNIKKNDSEIIRLKFEYSGIDNPDELKRARVLMEEGILDEPSVLLSEGNLIKKGFNKELDNLREVKENSRQILDQYLEKERASTGISSLKIRYNRLIGYFFEVTKTNLDKVPKHFIRRQGITGGERYSTDRLAALESEINGASDKVIDLERKIFLEIREEIKKVFPYLFTASRRLAELDAAQSGARAASVRNWVRPVLSENENILEITEGRHPVVEAHLSRGEYIPNDIFLYGKSAVNDENEKISFAMITGPNMAGKSTYLRSAALITIMAQAGSFVPAKDAKIGLCDRVYCRVGASDNLAQGESTFLVEMNETAFILNTATEKSLVIMDEVGRGTATNDGLSIAWAVSEELLNRIGCRTLFATHFHELSLLSNPRLANRSMEVLEKGDKIIFLRRIKEGPATESYGIHVAMLAGISQNVLNKAARIMSLLKERDLSLSDTFGIETVVNQQITTVNQNEINFLEKTLREIDPEQLTPLEALNILHQLKKSLENQKSGEILTEKRQAKINYKKINKKDEPSLFD
ncbi:MAG: DNA mismatch repair protein MutS [Treponema sp.]|nr:DNA mismatch repair protein MutS [Treponema sp.]